MYDYLMDFVDYKLKITIHCLFVLLDCLLYCFLFRGISTVSNNCDELRKHCAA